MRFLVMLLVALLMSTGVRAAPDGKWGGTLTSFESENPLAGATFTVPAVLWEPAGTARGAVILVHGSGGWSDYREGALGQELARRGFVALAIDFFAPRGISATVERQGGALASHVAYEAFAAKRFLVGRGIAADRIAIVGFSLGGVVAHYTSDRSFFPERTDQFVASVAYYPGCILHPAAPQPVARMLFLLGEDDDWTGVEPCKATAREYTAAGGQAQVEVYPDASHAFDGHPAQLQPLRLPKAESYVDCQAVMDPDRGVTYRDQRFAFPTEDLGIVRALQKTCTRYGVSLRTNPDARQAAVSRTLEFLSRALAKE